MSDFSNDKSKKKKKKRSFIQQTKRYAKNSNYGKGKQLIQEEYNYYMRILEQLKNVDVFEKEILIGSFFRELQKDGKLKELASNQIVSRILDDVLPLAIFPDFCCIMEDLSKDLRVISTDPFASHVLQTVLIQCLRKLQPGVEGNGEGESYTLTDEDKSNLVSFLIKASKFVLNNLEDFMLNNYAAHVIRTILEITSGQSLSKSIKGNQHAQCAHLLNEEVKAQMIIPPELSAIFPMFVDRFLLNSTENIKDIVTSPCASPVLQAIIITSVSAVAIDTKHFTKTISRAVQKTNFEGDCDSTAHPIFENNPASRLLDVLVTHCSAKEQGKLFKFFFENSLEPVIKHPSGNFALQKIIKEWKNGETFDTIFSAMDKRMLSVAFCERRFGVILSLVQACGRLQLHQNECIKSVMNVVHCQESTDHLLLAPLLSRMITKEHYVSCENGLPSFDLQGTLIVQEFLRYSNASKISQSILEMSSANLEVLSCDPRGSHIVDAFLSAQSMADKRKEHFIGKFKGKMTTLALSKHGGRSLESMFKVAGVKTKTWICQELSANENKIKQDKFGLIIYNNLQVRLFSRKDKSDWESVIKRQDKKRKLLEDIVGSIEKSPKKNKKKIKNESED